MTPNRAVDPSNVSSMNSVAFWTFSAVLLSGTLSSMILLGTQDCGGPTDEHHASSHELLLDTAGKRILERKELPLGMPAPDFALVNQDGEDVSLEDLRGAVLGIGFIYTSCPDVCGLLTASFLDLEREFASSIDDGDLQLVLITTDPETDVPERTKLFTTTHGARWEFLTGDMSACEEVWEDYGVNRTFNPSAGYVYHTYKIVLIDAEGNMRFDYVGLDDPDADLTRDITSLLGES